jgi:hypothetical protein
MGEGSASGTGRYDQRWLAECGAAQVLPRAAQAPAQLLGCRYSEHAVCRLRWFAAWAIKLRLTRPRPFCWIARPAS